MEIRRDDGRLPRPAEAGHDMRRGCGGPRAAPWFDPGWLMWRGLRDGAASAEDAFLLWLLRLPDGRDPAEAAGRVLAAYVPTAEDDLALLCRDVPDAARLLVLLEQARAYPRARLAGCPRGRRRRRARA